MAPVHDSILLLIFLNYYIIGNIITNILYGYITYHRAEQLCQCSRHGSLTFGGQESFSAKAWVIQEMADVSRAKKHRNA